MKPFSESLRYDYNLTPHSVVIDVGAHEANWSLGIWRRYGCRVIALEPIKEFYWNCINRCMDSPITVLNVGLGKVTRQEVFGKHGTMSGIYSDGPKETVSIISVVHLLNQLSMDRVDLIKINAEGGEYEILPGIMDSGLAPAFTNIQVQPHELGPDSAQEWSKIQAQLSRTHELDYGKDWVWEGWKLK